MYSRHDITEKTAKVDVKRQTINYKEGFAPLDPSTTFMHPDNHYRSYAHHIHLVWIYLHMCQPWSRSAICLYPLSLSLLPLGVRRSTIGRSEYGYKRVHNLSLVPMFIKKTLSVIPI
jgi:hypothetical protein